MIVFSICCHLNLIFSFRRYRHSAKWTFFFDVDEYIYLPDGRTLEAVLDELSPYTQFTIEQNPMSSKLCVLNPKEDHAKYVSILSLS
jgi:galactan beta-1,4-galactosyltransferase